MKPLLGTVMALRLWAAEADNPDQLIPSAVVSDPIADRVHPSYSAQVLVPAMA
jgi:hypothetical protein